MGSIPEFSSFRDKKPVRQGVLAYCRVSDPSQAERKNSLAQQRRIIQEHFEGRLGLEIIDWYVDEGKSASKDHEAREQFWAMVEHAKRDNRIGMIVVDEETRFFRDKYRTAAVKGELLKYGVRCLTAKRDVDPTTVAGLWMETIEETMAHASALANREHTLRGMAGNIHERDPDTGWGFKNGGAAPYGWKAKRIDMGHDSKGRPIARTIWLLDEPAAKVRRQILMWRKDDWSYQRIRDQLNELGIPSPRSGLWSQSTIQSMCREDMVWTAAGYAVWNKHYRKRKPIGAKFKPVEDWEVSKDAHPAIITEDEARAIIAVGKSRHKEWQTTRGNQSRSDYLLSGDNLEQEPLFICLACGGRMIGTRSSSRARPKYICSTYDRKGAQGCVSLRVDKINLEEKIIEFVRSNLLTEEYV